MTHKEKVTQLRENGLPFIKTPYNAFMFPKHQEVNTLPSKTIPDLSMSLRTLLDRYARGLPLPTDQSPVYYDDELLPDPRRLDLAELQELREQNARRIMEMQSDLQAQENAKKQQSAQQHQTQGKGKTPKTDDITVLEPDVEDLDPNPKSKPSPRK